MKSLIEHADGLREEAFTAHAVLRRMKANRTLEVVPVDVQGIINGTSPDVPLQNEDILFIPTLQERMQDRILTIEGEVQFPGHYDYADHMTVEDLILLAGGLTDAASTAKVDVSRRIRDEKALKAGEELAETYSFALKDGMTFFPADDKVFKTIALARQASQTGGSCPVVLNGANEVLVDLFLHGKIRFIEIQDTLERVLNEHEPKFNLDLEGVLEEDRKIRDYVRKLLEDKRG